MVTLVRVFRLLTLLVLTLLVVALVIGVASGRTGFVGQTVLIVLIAGCITAAVRISTSASKARERLLGR